MRGETIKKSARHDAGAYAQCFYCERYTEDHRSLLIKTFMCDCGKSDGWCGSFKPPTEDSKWSEARPEDKPAAPVCRALDWRPWNSLSRKGFLVVGTDGDEPNERFWWAAYEEPFLRRVAGSVGAPGAESAEYRWAGPARNAAEAWLVASVSDHGAHVWQEVGRPGVPYYPPSLLKPEPVLTGDEPMLETIHTPPSLKKKAIEAWVAAHPKDSEWYIKSQDGHIHILGDPYYVEDPAFGGVGETKFRRSAWTSWRAQALSTRSSRWSKRGWTRNS